MSFSEKVDKATDKIDEAAKKVDGFFVKAKNKVKDFVVKSWKCAVACILTLIIGFITGVVCF